MAGLAHQLVSCRIQAIIDNNVRTIRQHAIALSLQLSYIVCTDSRHRMDGLADIKLISSL